MTDAPSTESRLLHLERRCRLLTCLLVALILCVIGVGASRAVNEELRAKRLVIVDGEDRARIALSVLNDQSVLAFYSPTGEPRGLWMAGRDVTQIDLIRGDTKPPHQVQIGCDESSASVKLFGEHNTLRLGSFVGRVPELGAAEQAAVLVFDHRGNTVNMLSGRKQ